MASHLTLPLRAVFENILVGESFIQEDIHRIGHRVTIIYIVKDLIFDLLVTFLLICSDVTLHG